MATKYASFHDNYRPASGYAYQDYYIDIGYTETYNQAEKRSEVKLEVVQEKTTFSPGNCRFSGIVKFQTTGGTTVVTKTLSDSSCDITLMADSWGDVSNSSGGTGYIPYNTDGTASFVVRLEANQYTNFGAVFSGRALGIQSSNLPATLTVALPTHTSSLTVNPNGGTWGGSTSSQTFSQLPKTTKTVANPTRTGYTFSGWTRSGSTTGSISGTTYTFGDDGTSTTLTASWTPITYTVSYKKGDYGTGTNTSDTKTYNVALVLKGATFTRTGYTQDGWSVNSNGSTKDYNLSASYTANSAITLYPHWSLNTYKLTISQGSGSTISVNRTSSPIGGGSTGALSNNATIYYNDVLAISISANTGYDIGTHTVNGSNWASGNHTVKGATSVVSTATKKTFKLTITQGSKSTATVNRTESPIGGASTGNLSTNATLYYNDKLKVTFSASGGYHVTTHTVNGSTFTSGNTHTATAAVAVVSAAAANTYTVKFNANRGTASGSGTMADQSYTYDTAQNLRTNAFTRYYTVSFDGNGITNPASQNASSTFNGWATSASGSKAYDNSQSVKNLTTTNNGTVNLYAVWTNGSVTLPTPTRAGYTFNGWYTAATGGTKIGNGGASYTPTAAITLHAQWTRINYKLTLTKSDTGVTVSVTRNGTALSNNATIYYGDSLTVTYTVTAGYEILTHTINGSNFTSPATVSVTGNTEVVVTVKTSAHVYIGDGTNWTAYQIYIGNGSSWDLYQAYIGDGTNWVAY